MSVLPYVMRDFVDDLYHPAIYDRYLGLLPSNNLLGIRSLRPWRLLDSEISNVEEDANNFKVNLDVQQFKPEEISVKLSGDSVVIEGKHEERKDKHGFVSRQFCRRYQLPDNVDLEKLESHLSSDGVLSLVAPKMVELNQNGKRSIPIKHTNQPAALEQQPKKKKREA
ncbi:alpha-crystallin A chain-like [Nilaparvata lugens]|uniref:alpha-crystallin A chain-like n=1 Tax=Nilaparvata lugens TaxID=108931 RepID=UPI00193CAEAB|nr:alpha-crystallin A chain-like [Nilaparvata lugens]